MFNAYEHLPEGYTLTTHIDLKDNKKAFYFMNFLAILLFVVTFFVLGMILGTIEFSSLPAVLSLLPSIILLIIIHEWIHARFFKLAHNVKVRFKFHGFAASASVPDRYFTKKHYLITGLAPFVMLSILLIIILIFVPLSWTMLVAFLLAFHISGCAGDFYVAYLILKSDDSLLVQDYGIGMRFYEKKN